MPEDNDLRRVFARRDTTGENSFDELAKGLAVGTITRVQVLKLAGSAILSAMLNPLFFPSQALAQKECDPDEVLCGSKCCDPEDCCGSTCCGPARKCCGSTCCGPAQECCYGTCCENGKVCDAASGLCVCSPQRITCGSDCCDPVLETCGEDGLCHNPFCESCQAAGGQCSQTVEGGVLISEACCYSGERLCTRSGAGSICCPAGTRCPDEDLGEAFACVSL